MENNNITLRNYFAGLAMQSLIITTTEALKSLEPKTIENLDQDYIRKQIAITSYKMAKEMIKASNT